PHLPPPLDVAHVTHRIKMYSKPQMRALITGVGGFVGRHLLQHLQEEGDQVFGLGRASDVLGLESSRIYRTDLADRPAVERMLREIQPEAVYHLAAQSSPRESLA